MYYVPDYKLEQQEENPLYFCDQCNGDIYTGYTIYKLDKDTICWECLRDYFEESKRIAGEDY